MTRVDYLTAALEAEAEVLDQATRGRRRPLSTTGNVQVNGPRAVEAFVGAAVRSRRNRRSRRTAAILWGITARLPRRRRTWCRLGCPCMTTTGAPARAR